MYINKSIEILETPDSCYECPFRYESEKMPVGAYTYKLLFKCRKEPEMDYEEQEKFDPYVNDYMLTDRRAPWCPLRILTEEEEKKLTEILGELEVRFL